jgi:hypothetical protein
MCLLQYLWDPRSPGASLCIPAGALMSWGGLTVFLILGLSWPTGLSLPSREGVASLPLVDCDHGTTHGPLSLIEGPYWFMGGDPFPNPQREDTVQDEGPFLNDTSYPNSFSEID